MIRKSNETFNADFSPCCRRSLVAAGHAKVRCGLCGNLYIRTTSGRLVEMIDVGRAGRKGARR